ncbi:hypothetical protein [uncultured Clostridium sp.]|uniref:hypothetical protein n=1 Tax=uncultured Clostridium sp. TaxID=59620 RepID=UPI0028E5ED27|nr:hypothetical protein [uncultured Clostridium sp.]
MYAMPIVGESVMLYFPNRYDEPIVTGCVRKNGSSCSKLSNTDNRYFSTESGNNLEEVNFDFESVGKLDSSGRHNLIVK